MKKAYNLSIIITIMFFPIVVKAACSYEKLSKFKSISNNINYDYSFNEKNHNFKIRFTNTDSRLVIYDVTNKKEYISHNQNEIIVENFNPGQNYQFIVKTNNNLLSNNQTTQIVIKDGKYVEQTFLLDVTYSKCSNEILNNIYINLPAYNKYYNDPICNDFSQFKLCQKWYGHNLGYEEFKNQVSKAKENNVNKKENAIKNEDDVSFIVSIIEFFRKYYLYIIPIFILATIVIVVQAKKKNKSFEGW